MSVRVGPPLNLVSQSVQFKKKNFRDHEGKKYSFGIGRDLMYPIHVDRVIRKAERFEVHAGPIYNLPKTFGKVGLAPGLGRKNQYDDICLQKNGNYPGPGTYVSPREHIRDKFSVKQIQKNASPAIKRNLLSPSDARLHDTIDVYMSKEYLSTRRSPVVPKFMRGPSRFRISKDLTTSPSPHHHYDPQKSYDIGKVSRVFKNNGTTIIGKNTLDYIDFKNY